VALAWRLTSLPASATRHRAWRGWRWRPGVLT